MIPALILAFLLWVGLFAMFGRFVAPRWKVGGKLVFYLAISATLWLFTGPWALLWILGHPLLGVVGHVAWCRRNGIDWLSCQPRDKYIALRPWAKRDGFE